MPNLSGFIYKDTVDIQVLWFLQMQECSTFTVILVIKIYIFVAQSQLKLQ